MVAVGQLSSRLEVWKPGEAVRDTGCREGGDGIRERLLTPLQLEIRFC